MLLESSLTVSIMVFDLPLYFLAHSSVKKYFQLGSWGQANADFTHFFHMTVIFLTFLKKNYFSFMQHSMCYAICLFVSVLLAVPVLVLLLVGCF